MDRSEVIIFRKSPKGRFNLSPAGKSEGSLPYCVRQTGPCTLFSTFIFTFYFLLFTFYFELVPSRLVPQLPTGLI